MIAWIAQVMSRMSFCALFGVFVGVLVGGMYGALMSDPSEPGWATADVVTAGLSLGAVAWIAGILVLALLAYRIGPIVAVTLFNALVTSALTALGCHASGLPALVSLIGAVVGWIVGTVLCALCRRWEWLVKEGR